jgi:hypothetical protein
MEGGAALATERLGQQLGALGPEAVTQLSEGGVQGPLEDQGGLGGASGRRLPDDVEDDLFERRVAIVSMASPTGGAQIHLDVPRHGQVVAELEHRPLKVRPALQTSETRMKHLHRATV